MSTTEHADITAVDLVIEERNRQVLRRGFTAEHDQAHTLGELVQAAQAHLAAAQDHVIEAALAWPWDPERAPCGGDRPRFQHIIRAAALLIAELERLQPTLFPSHHAAFDLRMGLGQDPQGAGCTVFIEMLGGRMASMTPGDARKIAESLSRCAADAEHDNHCGVCTRHA